MRCIGSQPADVKYAVRVASNVLQNALAAECWTSVSRVSTSHSACGRAAAPYGRMQKDSSQFDAQEESEGHQALPSWPDRREGGHGRVGSSPEARVDDRSIGATCDRFGAGPWVEPGRVSY